MPYYDFRRRTTILLAGQRRFPRPAPSMAGLADANRISGARGAERPVLERL
jgi:hypothetical protein